MFGNLFGGSRRTEAAGKLEPWEGFERLRVVGDIPGRKVRALRKEFRKECRIDDVRTDIPGFKAASCHRVDYCLIFAGVSDAGEMVVGSAAEGDIADETPTPVSRETAADLGAAFLTHLKTGQREVGRFDGFEMDNWAEGKGLVPSLIGDRAAEGALYRAGVKDGQRYWHALGKYAEGEYRKQGAILQQKLQSFMAPAEKSSEPASVQTSSSGDAPGRLSAPGMEARIAEAAARRQEREPAALAKSARGQGGEAR